MLYFHCSFRRRWSLSILILIISLSSSTIYSQSYTETKQKVDQIAYYDCNITFDKTPGFIVGILYNDTSYIFPYGQLDKTKSVSISDSTIFELGGASKVLTALVCDDLVQDGVIHYDSTLHFYLENNVDTSKNSATIATVLSHQSGYPRLPTNFGPKEIDPNNPYYYYTKKDLWKYYQQTHFINNQLEYDYSHTGYALLELALEKRTNLPFDKLLEKVLIDKHQLDDTTIQFKKGQQIAPAYNAYGKQVNYWTSPAFNAAVGIKSSMRDLIRVMELQINTDQYNHTHQKKVATLIDKNSSAALGWHLISEKKQSNIVLHSGATEGHRVFMGFVKETKTAVIVLSNSKNGTKELGYLLLKRLNASSKKKKKAKKSK